MRLLLAVRRLILMSAILAGTTVVEASPASASYIGNQQFNMCGADTEVDKCPAERTTKPAQLVWWWVANSSTKPWIVTVNEVCDTQWTYLLHSTRMPSLGYSAFRSVTKYNAGTGCGNYGNGIFLLGTPDSAAGSGFNTAYTNQSSTTEIRKMLCQRMNSVIGQYAGCVTHLAPTTSSSSTTATQQANEGEGWVTTNYYAIPRFVGGDFNLTPSTSGMATWIGSAGGYKDTDPGLNPTFRLSLTTTASPTKKIDYLLADKSHFPYAPNASRDCKSDYSDHCYLLGNHQF